MAAQPPASRAVTTVDSLKECLERVATANDSITLLYNIFDCSEQSKKTAVLEQLYEVASRTGDIPVVCDVLRLSINHYSTNDSMKQVLYRRAKALPEGDERDATLLFINVRTTAREVHTLPEDKREAKLREYLARHESSKSLSTYERIEYLFYLCAYLRLATEGDMLTQYLRELQVEIDKLPTRDLSLKSLFYTQAAVSYLTNHMYAEAAEANKTLLDIIDELQRQYQAQGRMHRQYNLSLYVCYRRLLSCAEALKPEEVDIYYNRLLSLVDADPVIREEFENRQRATIYYYMAKQRYAEAIPLIKKQLQDSTNTRTETHYLVQAMLTAAEEAGNTEDLLTALKLSNEMLRDRIRAKAAERYRELQILYEVNNLKRENDDLMLANRQSLDEKHSQQLIFSMVCVTLLAIIIVVLVFVNRRSRQLAASLAKSNEMLSQERDTLQRTQNDLLQARDKAKVNERYKNDFVNNMSHEIRTPLAAIVEYSGLIADCVNDEHHTYVKKFADLVSLNTDLLLTLVNDVLDLRSIENAKFTINPVTTSLKEICEVSVSAVRKHVRRGVELIFCNENDPDMTVHTDPQRVEQVLIHMLSNAAKFTEKGSIMFEYSLSDDKKMVVFTVTDTGIGIPRGKEEVIFSRFEKLDSSTQGNGLGLYISRLLANLLKGDLVLDKEYRAGARFIFTIPVA